VHIDALDAAAGLAGIVEGAVHQRLDRSRKIGVRTDIGRVLAPQLQRQRGERAGRSPLDRASALDRAGEGGVIDKTGLEQPNVCSWLRKRVVEEAVGQPRHPQRLVESLSRKQGLARMLEEHRVAAISAGTMVLAAVRNG
jgi:hypothetical protein